MPTPVIVRTTHEIDAAGKVVGRLATHIAKLLIGKHKASYAPNVDAGDLVRVTNPGKLVLTGSKARNKEYFHYSGYHGGMKVRKAWELQERDPGRILRLAVDRMLPKNTLRARRLKRLTIVK